VIDLNSRCHTGTVSGQYTYSAPGGIAEIGTTTTPVTYAFPTDVLVDINNLRLVDSNYPIYDVVSGRSVTGTFLNPQNNAFGGRIFPPSCRPQRRRRRCRHRNRDLADILANSPLWRANFFDPANARRRPRQASAG
jgi:hypothetical protein